MESSVFVPRPPSFRSQVLARGSATFLRPLTSVIPDSDLGVAAARTILATGLATLGRTHRGTAVQPIATSADGGTVRGEWVRARRVRDDAVILYIHGSGYAACSPKTHRGLVSRLSAATRLPVFSVDYRLAPEHKFPAAADDVEATWNWLTKSLPADRIVVAGDSAGGHLALDLALALVRAGKETPAALALFSPLADVTFALASQRERAVKDPMTSAEGGRRLVAHYVGATDPAHPRLAHRIEPHETLPPTLIQAGGLEMLAADAHHLHDQLRGGGAIAELEVWPGQMHVFQAMPRVVPEADVALRRASRFLATHLEARSAIAQSSHQREVGA